MQALIALVCAALFASVAAVETAEARDNKSHEYRFEFANGQVITGSSVDNVAFLSNAGGTDAANPIGMEVHVSCSDDFPDGWGEKDGPDPQRDSAWQIVSWEITKFKNGRQDKKCSGGAPVNPPRPPAPPQGANPEIDLIKRVNGEDANDPMGPVVLVGETVTLDYEVSNPGDVTLIDVAVVDNDLGEIVCPSTTLAPGESMDCASMQVDVVSPGQVFMEAHAYGSSEVALPAPPVPNDNSKGYAWSVAFVNGQVITGTSEKNVAFLPDAGGTDVNNPTGMELHVSCSDDFPDGWGEKDGPDQFADSAWQIASYEIVKYDKNKIKKTCGDAFSPVMQTVEDSDPIHYFAEQGVPSIDLEKYVAGDDGVVRDADDAPGPTYIIGEVLTITYVVTNTGSAPLSHLLVFDFTEGLRPCAVTDLAPGESTTCLEFTHELVAGDAGLVNMQAVALAQGAGTVVFDIDPVNFQVAYS